MTQTAPSLADIEEIALKTVDALPEAFRTHARALALQVVEFAPPELIGPETDPWEITGLYDGIPMTEKSFGDMPEQPDCIWLFRRPILDEWIARADVTLTELVAHVTVHEFAHHFGWSDDDIAAVDEWWL